MTNLKTEEITENDNSFNSVQSDNEPVVNMKFTLTENRLSLFWLTLMYSI